LAALGPSISLLLRTRRYLADASAVQLTRNPDGLASALQKLSENDTVIPGGNWASHLFVVSLGRGKSGNSSGPNPRQQALLARAWAASGNTMQSSDASQASELDFTSALREFRTVQRAALSGDAQAVERLRAARKTLEDLDPSLAAQMPDPADLLGARHGDGAAIARLRAIHDQQSAGGSPPQEDSSSGASSNSFFGSHPSLRRRLKRLDQMGAHAEIAAADRKLWIVAAIFSLIMAPFVIAAVALLLILIAVMTMASLTFLVVWLAFINKAFTFFGHR
jgi:hypothetical protein